LLFNDILIFLDVMRDEEEVKKDISEIISDYKNRVSSLNY